ncbi:tRNA (adenosine(37)-N6)-threonylcarbamoyltransferase complex transferase subunit TsaD [Candidatus Peregrinibacteria bacterium CG_4_10_14_0_2_um_filter_43_11]|nr:MAG: tRNA (adenosine(37)-N6)-threonylcarbamoyltransferase complex transferase subunit TsaD [Candidatus Peregrinibacteria bacterium CG_4_10_14_0_2_um_filter_43_11]
MLILGIETSCDETAASIVRNGTEVLSNVIASSLDLHRQTGGVVPEVAAREHLRQISPVIDRALSDASATWLDVDVIAVTHAPGLVAALLVGVNTAQTLAYIHQKPLIPVHHVSGHIYANFIDRKEDPRFPILILTVSGGHNELVLMKGHHDFEVIGETLDDAAGEAFDKVARMLNLGFPGGPVIAKTAIEGRPDAYAFPRAQLDKDNRFNFSFSGLKSAVLREVKLLEEPSEKQIADLAAGFQMAVVDVLSDKLIAAAEAHDVSEIHLAGGVSANLLLREVTRQKLPENISLIYPKNLIYCTDNAAMIAASGYFLFQRHPNTDWDWKDVIVQASSRLT